jgi:hypothetical protein
MLNLTRKEMLALFWPLLSKEKVCTLKLSSIAKGIFWEVTTAQLFGILVFPRNPRDIMDCFFPTPEDLVGPLLNAPDLHIEVVGGSGSSLSLSAFCDFGSFPRAWRLFSYLLPRKTRDRVFEPAYQDLVDDYLTTRAKYRTKWAKRWLTFCYTLRTCLMVLDCLRAMLADKAIALLARVVPERLKHWWLSK